MILDNDKASLTYKKNLNGFDIKMSSNYNFMGEIPDYGAEIRINFSCIKTLHLKQIIHKLLKNNVESI